jgi:hypothetical protein
MRRNASTGRIKELVVVAIEATTALLHCQLTVIRISTSGGFHTPAPLDDGAKGVFNSQGVVPVFARNAGNSADYSVRADGH